MSKHTPGPWKVFNAWQDHRDQSIQFTRIGTDETTVLHAEDSQVEIIAPNEADLHLITTAFELLNGYADVVSELHDVYEHRGTFQDCKSKQCVNARALIAKAKGE